MRSKFVCAFLLVLAVGCGSGWKQPTYPPNSDACSAANGRRSTGTGLAAFGTAVGVLGASASYVADDQKAADRWKSVALLGSAFAIAGVAAIVDGTGDLVAEGCGSLKPRARPEAK